jgi:hypothetical protein
MMLAAEGSEYGALNGVVQTASAVVSAAIAIGALWWARPKLADVPEALVKSGEVVLTAIGIVLIWTRLSEPSSSPELTRWLVVLAIALSVALVVLVVLSIGCSLIRERHTPDAERVVGGFWLSTAGRNAVTTFGNRQEAYHSLQYNAGDTWPLPSRILAQGLFLIFDWVVAVSGSVALAGAAILVLIYQVPRIYEFSISPLSVETNGTATIHWKVSDNASKVQLDPFGQVATQGERPEQIVKNSEFKLTATNTFGSRSIEQGVAVHPPLPPEAPPPEPRKKTKRPPAPAGAKPPDLIIEARTCSLIKNVVIRGAGWLESENENDPNAISRATCSKTFPTAAKYEVFITYAAAESWPVRVAFNQKIIDDSALAAPTGGWNEPNQKDQSMGVWSVNAGVNTVEFYREHPIPHIERIRFRPIS